MATTGGSPGSAAERPAQAAALPDPAWASALAEHRIARIDARRLQDRYPRRLGCNARRGSHGRGGGYQVRILTTDRGARGWGMSHVPDDRVRPFVGRRVADLYDIRRGVVEEAYCLDIPLHDLVGNILHRPVRDLLGAAGPRELPIYSGAIYFDDLEPRGRPRGVRAVLDGCRQDYDVGYRAFKLKIGRGFRWMPREDGIRRDIEVTRAVRERFPDCRILVDANDGYSVADFCRYVGAVADCNLYWIEEPFRENRDDLRRLRDHMARVGCRALIADGEARRGRAREPWRYGDYPREHVETLFALARERLVDVFLLDLGIVGYSRWRQIMPELVRAGVRASPHTWAWIPRPIYAAQLGGGVGNVCIVEGIPGTTGGVDYSAYRFRDGNLVLPAAPGFGLTLGA